MRRTAIDPGNQSQTSGGFAVPAPTGGWNARDALADMPATDAVYLDNWFPSFGQVTLRPGSANYATLTAGKIIASLLECAKVDGTRKRFAVAQDGVYDVSSAGVIGAAAYAVTNSLVESQNINVAGVNYLWCCNGTDDSFIYKSDTNSFQPINAASTPALTGLTSANVTHVALWQNRLVLCEKNSLKWYYMPLNSVGGAAAAFDMGASFSRGGYILATANWSVDAGDGPQDRLVVVSSEGEVAVFSGTDPSIATAFSRIGLYYIGRPVSKRCVFRLPGDLAIVTESGIWALTRLMANATLDRKSSLSDKIIDAFTFYADNYSANNGWQGIIFQGGPALLVNVPVTSSISYQLVMNLTTKAWCRFFGWNASCFLASGGSLFYAINNSVYQAWTGAKDRNGAITARAKQAFLYPSRQKISHVKLVRPILTSTKSLIVGLGLDTDFSELTDYNSVTSYSSAISKWDQALWDSAVWSNSQVLKGWKSVSHSPGKAFALRMQVQALDTTVSWSSTDYVTQAGGPFG